MKDKTRLDAEPEGLIHGFTVDAYASRLRLQVNVEELRYGCDLLNAFGEQFEQMLLADVLGESFAEHFVPIGKSGVFVDELRKLLIGRIFSIFETAREEQLNKSVKLGTVLDESVG